MADVFGAVNVPLAILWVEPGHMRSHDYLLINPSAAPQTWADGMDDEMRLWLVGKVETQALFGERVAVLDQREDWLLVAVIDQKTNRNSLGYPGWIPASQISQNPVFLEEQLSYHDVIVNAVKTALYRDQAKKEIITELSYQTKLPMLSNNGSAVTVGLPDGSRGYLSPDAVKHSTTAPFAAKNLIEDARRFFGLRYIWGGTSAYGFDCSGFTMRIYESQGITIPRDADEQASGGISVLKEDLALGDLLFFADNKGTGTIHHVGMYSGEDTMIHAPHSRSMIRQESFLAGTYGEEFWGARRYR